MSKNNRKFLDIIKALLNAQGYKTEYPYGEVETAIMKERGIDERTVKRWLRALIKFEFLLVKVEDRIFCININAIPKEIKQTLTIEEYT